MLNPICDSRCHEYGEYATSFRHFPYFAIFAQFRIKTVILKPKLVLMFYKRV